MKSTCQHCGSPCAGTDRSDGFCCDGCAQVYRLIREEGFEGYYELRDRTGQPLGTQPFEARDADWAQALQAGAEAVSDAPVVTLALSGMSCMGCVWLVERLGRRAPGVRSVRVSLERQTVELEWARGGFSLQDLVREWQRFGYRAEPMSGTNVRRLSPLVWRTLLCGIFAGNGLLLAAPDLLGMSGFAYSELFGLLALLCAFLSFSVGASFFILPVCQALRVKNLHYDLLPALGLCLVFVDSVFGSFSDGARSDPLWLFSLLVVLALAGRLTQRWLWGRSAAVSGEVLERWVLLWAHGYMIGLIVLALPAAILFSMQGAIGGLLAGGLYPVARSVGYAPSRWVVGLGLLLGLTGFMLALLGVFDLLGAVCWMGASGLLWSVLFFRSKGFCIIKRT